MTGTEAGGPAGTEAVLEAGGRCLMACRQQGGPLILPLAHWYDGEALWALAPVGAPEVAALEGGGGCAVHVRGERGAAVARGQARLLSLRDPAGLLLRLPAITGAMAALALRDPPALLERARGAVLQPRRSAPGNLAVLHVKLAGMVTVPDREPPAGVAPALPTALPADMRRGLAAARRVVIARRDAAGGEPVEIVPGWWDQRYTLVRASDGRPLAGSEPVAVALDVGAGSAPHEDLGLVLYGHTRDGVLEAARATYWRGSGIERVEVPPARSEIMMPD